MRKLTTVLVLRAFSASSQSWIAFSIPRPLLRHLFLAVELEFREGRPPYPFGVLARSVKLGVPDTGLRVFKAPKAQRAQPRVERSGTLGLCHEDTQLQLLKELKEWAQRTKHRAFSLTTLRSLGRARAREPLPLFQSGHMLNRYPGCRFASS